MDQRALAEASGLSLPTIQRMEASEGVIRGNVDSLMKLIAALEAAGVELINEGAVSEQRRTRRSTEGALIAHGAPAAALRPARGRARATLHGSGSIVVVHCWRCWRPRRQRSLRARRAATTLLVYAIALIVSTIALGDRRLGAR